MIKKAQGPLTPELEEYDDKDMDRRSWWKGFAAGIFLCTALGFVISFFWQPSAMIVWKEGGLSHSQAEQLVNKVDLLLNSLEDNYLESLDTEVLLDGAYHGVMEAVGDPYTRYYTEEEYIEYKESSSGKYVGIGVTVRLAEDGGAEITAVEGSGPAAEAGLMIGDTIIGADGTDLTSLELEEIVSRIKGEEGTEVSITYLRKGQSHIASVIRRTIESVTVNSEMLEEGIGYIAIDSFDGVTTDQFLAALDDLKNQGLEGLIVDLRNNPGGRVDVVQRVTDELVPGGIITYTEDKYGNREIYESSDSTFLDLPLVVLINGSSASASEIMAGAIKDMGVGTLVGTKTYGKGIVQQTTAYTDGTAVKITMAKYYTPNGEYIHEIGIQPDINVELPAGVTFSSLGSHEEDLQLQTALEALKTKMEK